MIIFLRTFGYLQHLTVVLNCVRGGPRLHFRAPVNHMIARGQRPLAAGGENKTMKGGPEFRKITRESRAQNKMAM